MTVTASNFDRKENELYETEPWATAALLRHFPVHGCLVWEPAAGNHKMVEALCEAGADVICSDIATYSQPHDFEFDFFSHRAEEVDCDCIITNPPYGRGNRQAVRFCELALERCDNFVALLLTAKFDFGKTRRHLFKDNPRFAAKIALLNRISWAGNGETGTEDHAWYVWGDAHVSNSPSMIWEAKQ